MLPSPVATGEGPRVRAAPHEQVFITALFHPHMLYASGHGALPLSQWLCHFLGYRPLENEERAGGDNCADQDSHNIHAQIDDHSRNKYGEDAAMRHLQATTEEH